MRAFGCVIVLFLLACPARAGDKTLDVGPKGLEVDGAIKADDPKIKISFMGETRDLPSKQFTLKLKGGHRYRFTLDTDDPKFDPFLVLKTNEGDLLIQDDDSGGKLNSLFTFTPPAEGASYQLFAASLDGKAGPYKLSIQAQAKVLFDAKQREVGKGLRLEGELSEDRQEVIYLVKLAAGKKYRFDLSSSRFDSYLELRDKSGRLLAENDDRVTKDKTKAKTLDAGFSKSIAEEGVYRVVASSTNLNQTGPFVLEIREE